MPGGVRDVARSPTPLARREGAPRDDGLANWAGNDSYPECGGPPTGDDTIVFVVDADLSVYGDHSDDGNLDIDVPLGATLTIEGTGPAGTILSAFDGGRLFEVHGALVLSNLTVYGAGLNGCILTTGDVTTRDARFERCRGDLAVAVEVRTGGRFEGVRTTFVGGTGDMAGGIWASSARGVTCTACSFSGNAAGEGAGAIGIEDGPLGVVDSLFISNRGGNGGAIQASGSGERSIVGSDFFGNAAYFSGGAIFSEGSGRLVGHGLGPPQAVGGGDPDTIERRCDIERALLVADDASHVREPRFGQRGDRGATPQRRRDRGDGIRRLGVVGVHLE